VAECSPLTHCQPHKSKLGLGLFSADQRAPSRGVSQAWDFVALGLTQGVWLPLSIWWSQWSWCLAGVGAVTHQASARPPLFIFGWPRSWVGVWEEEADYFVQAGCSPSGQQPPPLPQDKGLSVLSSWANSRPFSPSLL
jgi:hypothetical protein